MLCCAPARLNHVSGLTLSSTEDFVYLQHVCLGPALLQCCQYALYRLSASSNTSEVEITNKFFRRFCAAVEKSSFNRLEKILIVIFVVGTGKIGPTRCTISLTGTRIRRVVLMNCLID